MVLSAYNRQVVRGGAANPVCIINPEDIYVPYLHRISHGLEEGKINWNKMGYNPDVDTGIEDMIPQGGLYVFPATGIQMDVVSDSANDTAGGSGVQQVQIVYLDNGYQEKATIVSMNGVTAVPTSVSDIFRVNYFRAAACGSGKVAAGNISLNEHGGTTYKYSYILATKTRARQCVYTVPVSHELCIHTIGFSVGSATATKSVVFTDLATWDSLARLQRDFFCEYYEIVLQDNNYSLHLQSPTVLPEKTDLKVQVRALNDNCVCTCSLLGYLEDIP